MLTGCWRAPSYHKWHNVVKLNLYKQPNAICERSTVPPVDSWCLGRATVTQKLDRAPRPLPVHEMEAEMKKILVIDIPEGISAEELERILNEPIDRGYYLDKLYGGGGLGAVGRAVFKLRVKDIKV